MKKQTLNEEISRMKNMMGKLMNEQQKISEIANYNLSDQLNERLSEFLHQMVCEKLGVPEDAFEYTIVYDDEGRGTMKEKYVDYSHLEDKYDEISNGIDISDLVDESINAEQEQGIYPLKYGKEKIVEYLNSI
jgi:hypothetical protein